MGSRFVWLVTNGKLEAQKWPADGTASASRNYFKYLQTVVAAEHILPPDEEVFSIDMLIAHYPAPSKIGELIPP